MATPSQAQCYLGAFSYMIGSLATRRTLLYQEETLKRSALNDFGQVCKLRLGCKPAVPKDSAFSVITPLHSLLEQTGVPLHNAKPIKKRKKRKTKTKPNQETKPNQTSICPAAACKQGEVIADEKCLLRPFFPLLNCDVHYGDRIAEGTLLPTL